MARIDDLIAGRDLNKHGFRRRENSDLCRICGKPQEDPIHHKSAGPLPHPYRGLLTLGSRCTDCGKPYRNKIHTNYVCKSCGKPIRVENPEVARCSYCGADVMP